MIDCVEFEKQTENALYLRLKDPGMMDSSVFARMETDSYALGCLVIDEKSGQLMFSTQNLIPLSSFFKGYTFERQEGYLFLMSLLEKAIAVNRSKPVVLDTDYIYVSSHGDEAYFVVLPLQLEFWMFQKEDCICFVQQILDEMKCRHCYELPGYLVQFMKADQFSLPNLICGIRDLMDVYYPKKLFRKQPTHFRARQPVHASFYSPVPYSSRPAAPRSCESSQSAQPTGLAQGIHRSCAVNPAGAGSQKRRQGMESERYEDLQAMEREAFGPANRSVSPAEINPGVPAANPQRNTAASPSSFSAGSAQTASEGLHAGSLSLSDAPPQRKAALQEAPRFIPGTWSQEDALYEDDLSDLLEGPFDDPFDCPAGQSEESPACSVHISEGMGSSQVWQPETLPTGDLESMRFGSSRMQKQVPPVFVEGHPDRKQVPGEDPALPGKAGGLCSPDADHLSKEKTLRQESLQTVPQTAPVLGATVPVSALMQEETATQVLMAVQESWGSLESEGQTYPLRFEVTTIGRHVSNDICLSSSAVSSRHARILKKAGQYYLQDLNSTNKTWVYGRPIREEVRLLEGMELKFGDQEALFHEPPV